MKRKISRLRKVVADAGFGGFAGGGGFSGGAVPILVGNPEELVDEKDAIRQLTYGPSLSHEFLFEEPTDYAEWQLRDSD